MTAVSAPTMTDMRKARRMLSLSASTPNQCRLKPVIGKPPNCEALNDSVNVTRMGANMKT